MDLHKINHMLSPSLYHGCHNSRVTLFNGGHNIPHPYDISILQRNIYVTDFTTQSILNISRLDPRNDMTPITQSDNNKLSIYQIEMAAVERQRGE